MHDDATSSTANSLTQRFLSAVEDLRAELDHAAGLDSRGFEDAWAKAYSKRVPAVVRNHDLGEVLHNLRNTIAHNNYKNGQPIATPRADLVEAAERLLFQVRNGPQIQNFMVHDVATVSLPPRTPSLLSPPFCTPTTTPNCRWWTTSRGLQTPRLPNYSPLIWWPAGWPAW